MTKVLLIHDDLVLSSVLASQLCATGFTVAAIDAPTATDEELREACASSAAVVYLSNGWEAAVAERELRQIATLIAALEGRRKRLVYVSEASVIGDTADSFGNEDNGTSSHAPHPWRVEAEGRINTAVSVGIHSAIVRPALVHGRKAGALLQVLTRHAIRTGQSVYLDDGSARISTIHVDDVASLISAVLARAPEGASYIAASDEVLTWRDVADVVAKQIGHCTTASITATQAAANGLDAATMAMNCVIRDVSPTRRLGWHATGPALAPSQHRRRERAEHRLATP